MLIQFPPTKVRIKIGTDKENCKKPHSFITFYGKIEEKYRFLAKKQCISIKCLVISEESTTFAAKMTNRMEKMNIAIFVSGSGTNCENLIKYFADHASIKPALVVSNKQDAYALVRAERLGVPTAVTPKADLNNPDVILPLLEKYDIGFIVLAGFLPLVPNFLINAYPHKIINIHPALLPKYGGKGMWGHHVHEAVKAAGETETGMTVHWVTPVCDAGEIIAQFRVALSPDDSVDDIAEKEHQLEMKYFPKVVEEVISGNKS